MLLALLAPLAHVVAACVSRRFLLRNASFVHGALCTLFCSLLCTTCAAAAVL